jgi:hypothetical protein
MFTFTLYGVAAVLLGCASRHVLKSSMLVKPSAGGSVGVPPLSVMPPPPESPQDARTNVRISENASAVINMNLGREIGGGGGGYFVSCHGVYGYSFS